MTWRCLGGESLYPRQPHHFEIHFHTNTTLSNQSVTHCVKHTRWFPFWKMVVHWTFDIFLIVVIGLVLFRLRSNLCICFLVQKQIPACNLCLVLECPVSAALRETKSDGSFTFPSDMWKNKLRTIPESNAEQGAESLFDSCDPRTADTHSPPTTACCACVISASCQQHCMELTCMAFTSNALSSPYLEVIFKVINSDLQISTRLMTWWLHSEVLQFLSRVLHRMEIQRQQQKLKSLRPIIAFLF